MYWFFMCCLSSWNSSQQKTIINAMAVNEDGVMVTGGNKFISQLFFVIVFLPHLAVIINFLTKLDPISVYELR